MGKLVIVIWARLLGLTSAACSSLLYCPLREISQTDQSRSPHSTNTQDVLWATLWAFYYPKFFWDFIDGELGPRGLNPSERLNFFIKIIVTYPIVQTINLVLSLFTLLLEYPFPLLNRFKLSRSIPLRIVLHFLDFSFAMLLYQTIDGGVFHLVTGFVYFVAWLKGETLDIAGEGGGIGGRKELKEKTVGRVERI
ncbi:hypothetical protein JCM5350_008116 [Sporobolomyces pararoseus]